MEGGAAHRNWAAPVAPLAGEEVGKDEGLTGARFVLPDGVGRRSAAAACDGVLMVNSCIKVHLDLQADKSPIIVKGPFFP
jgi:hypothetical protein